MNTIRLKLPKIPSLLKLRTPPTVRNEPVRNASHPAHVTETHESSVMSNVSETGAVSSIANALSNLLPSGGNTDSGIPVSIGGNALEGDAPVSTSPLSLLKSPWILALIGVGIYFLIRRK